MNMSVSASAAPRAEETPERGEHDERQQQHEREIAEERVAEDQSLERAQITQPRAAVVKNLLAAFERAERISGEHFCTIARPMPS